MAAADKDVHQKAKAIRFCLAAELIPFYEVNVNNVRELTDTPELLTDIDVLGVSLGRFGVRRTLFDCKTIKTSPINRAFWAAGLMRYADADEAFVILKKAASETHKLSAKSMRVHLFDEALFDSHASALAPAYHDGGTYAANIDNWHQLHAELRSNAQIRKLGDHLRHFLPLESDFAKTLRGVVANLKQVRGELDPAWPAHMAIFAYVVFAMAFAMAPIIRDFFDAFDPKQPKEDFERFLRAYVWGGRDAYLLRRKLRELMAAHNENVSAEVELSGWETFVELVRAFLDAPEDVQACCNPMIGMSLRYVAKQSEAEDRVLAIGLAKTNRIRQFIFRLSEYVITASGLPKDFDARLKNDVNTVMSPGATALTKTA